MRDLIRQARQVEEVQAGAALAADLVEAQAEAAQVADLVEVQEGMAPDQRKPIGTQFSEAVYPHSRLLLSPSKGPS